MQTNGAFIAGPLTALEKKALDAIDEEALIKCLQDLIRIPSISGTKEENEAQRWFAEQMRQAGLSVDLWPIPLVETRADAEFPGCEVERTEALGLVGTWGADANDAEAKGRTLVLDFLASLVSVSCGIDPCDL